MYYSGWFLSVFSTCVALFTFGAAMAWPAIWLLRNAILPLWFNCASTRASGWASIGICRDIFGNDRRSRFNMWIRKQSTPSCEPPLYILFKDIQPWQKVEIRHWKTSKEWKVQDPSWIERITCCRPWRFTVRKGGLWGWASKGRGLSKVWTKDEEDLRSMYESHNKDQEIVLWCEGRQDNQEHNSGTAAGSAGRKRKSGDTCNNPTSKR